MSFSEFVAKSEVFTRKGLLLDIQQCPDLTDFTGYLVSTYEKATALTVVYVAKNVNFDTMLPCVTFRLMVTRLFAMATCNQTMVTPLGRDGNTQNIDSNTARQRW